MNIVETLLVWFLKESRELAHAEWMVLELIVLGIWWFVMVYDGLPSGYLT